MEEQSQLSNYQKDEKIDESVYNFNPDDILNKTLLSKDDNEEDFQELINLFNQKKPKKEKKKNSNISFLINQFENSSKSLKYDVDINEKLKIFLLRVYGLICKDDEQNELIDKEEIEHDDNNNDEEYFLNIIKYINNYKENENDKKNDNKIDNKNYNMEISIKGKKCSFNGQYFIIYLKEKHEINMCNELLIMKIEIKLEIKMAITNGNVQIKFNQMKIYYNGKNQKLKLKPNLKCTIINSFIGKRGITFCTCENCARCENRKKLPFDDLLFYLKEKNGINNKLKFTFLYFKGYNSYKNDSNYKCSFCKDFYAKKLNIVRLFCNPEIDPEHTCQFWICKDCYRHKFNYGTEEICPNCGKFKINFAKLKSYSKWKLLNKK